MHPLPLPASAMADIVNHDHAVHVTRGCYNRNRFYLYLQAADSDMEVHVVAVKADKLGKVHAKEVVRASVDEPFIYMRDIAYHGMGGYVVDWSREGLGPKRQWDYNGRWDSEAYARRCLWKVYGTLVNPEELQNHARFQYCAYKADECGGILDYLKVYAKHPNVELLTKAGLGRFGTKGGFVSQLEADKGLTRFVLQNLAEIKRLQYGADVIRRAYKQRVSLADASAFIVARHRFRGEMLPKSINPMNAMAYVTKQGISTYTFGGYIRDLISLGRDLADSKNAFPRNFKQRRQVVADLVAERKRREDARLAAQQDAIIAATAKRYAKLERASLRFRLLLPRRCADLVREGKRMHNCLGDGHYSGRIVRGESIIVFVRRKAYPRAAFVAVEYSLTDNRIHQCYGAKNSRPPAVVSAFVEKRFKMLNAVKGGAGE